MVTGKLTIYSAMFNGYVKLLDGIIMYHLLHSFHGNKNTQDLHNTKVLLVLRSPICFRWTKQGVR